MTEDASSPRRLAARVFRVVVWPVSWVLGIAVVKGLAVPRRVPDLVRFTRSDGLRKLHGSAAAWTGRHFELIERAAPWLERIGSRVFDHCHTSRGNLPFTNIRDPRSVMCSRDAAVLYAFDGDLAPRLAELSAILQASGWGTGPVYLRSSGRTERLQLQEPPARASWWPTSTLAYPEGLETEPPLGRSRTIPRMMVAWASPGQSAESVAFEAKWPDDVTVATAWYQPVEVEGSAFSPLAARALARHQHTLVIEIELVYYSNPNVNVRPNRLRKRLLPVRR